MFEYSYDIDGKTVEKMKAVVVSTKLLPKSKQDVVRRALGLYLHASEVQKAGCYVAIVSSDGSERRMLL